MHGCIAEAYIQFQKFSGEAATLYNVAKGDRGDGHYLLSNSDVRVKATPDGKKTLITATCIVGGPG